MNYVFQKITAISTGFDQVGYELKNLLKTAGWTVRASGDGLSSYSSTTDIFTSISSGANGWGNVRAWYRIASPSGNEEYVFQRTSVSALRMKFSPIGKFTGGSPSSTVTPSASDEAITGGGGTDASPIGVNASGVLNYRLYIGADIDPPYSWYVMTIIPGGYSGGTLSVMPFFIGHDGLTNIEPTDTSKVFSMVMVGSTMAVASYSNAAGTGPSSTGAYFCSRIPSNNMTPTTAIGWNIVSLLAGSATMAGNCPGNVITLKEEILPFGLWRQASLANPAFKGLANTFRLLGSNRSPGDTLSVNTTRDRILYGQFVLPWDGSIPVV